MFGMSERIGLAYCAQRQPAFLNGPQVQFQRDCSELTAREIDEEVKKLLDRSYAEAKEILAIHREQLERVAAELQRRETLDGADFYKLIGKELPLPRESAAAAPVAAGNSNARPKSA